MATTTGTQGCSAHSVPDASKFNEVAPAAIDTDQWCQAIASFGGKYATIVAKHVCGFAIWDTHVSMRMRMRTAARVYKYSEQLALHLLACTVGAFHIHNTCCIALQIHLDHAMCY